MSIVAMDAACPNGKAISSRRGWQIERPLTVLSLLANWFYGGTLREIREEIPEACERTIRRDLNMLHALGLITRETCPATRVVRYRINKNSPLVAKLFGKAVLRG